LVVTHSGATGNGFVPCVVEDSDSESSSSSDEGNGKKKKKKTGSKA
jgi:hypothetical protein